MSGNAAVKINRESIAELAVYASAVRIDTEEKVNVIKSCAAYINDPQNLDGGDSDAVKEISSQAVNLFGNYLSKVTIVEKAASQLLESLMGVAIKEKRTLSQCREAFGAAVVALKGTN